VPDYHLTCNRLGQLDVVVDPMLQDTGDRSATIQAAIGEDDWREIMFPHKRPPRVHWLRSDAILADADTITAIFSVAPGEAPGQGEMVRQQSEQLAQSQADLNACEGHRYARLNAKEGFFTVTLVGNDDLDIDPASMEWVSLQITADTAMERGYTWDVARGLVHELNISYEHTKTGLLKTVMARWEIEVDGPTAVTEDAPDPPDDPPPPYIPPPWEPPEEDPDEWPESPKIAIFLGADFTYWYTEDVTETPPTWQEISIASNGTALKLVYIQTNDENVGGWMLSTTGVWYCDNILTTSPSWNGKLTITDTQASGLSGAKFVDLAVYQSDPDFVIVTYRHTDTLDNTTIGYGAMYSTDRGASWNESTFNYGAWQHGGSGINAEFTGNVDIEESTGKIYVIHGGEKWSSGLTGYRDIHVFYSTDGGVNFTEGGMIGQYSGSGGSSPSFGDDSAIHTPILAAGTVYASCPSHLYTLAKSTDGAGSFAETGSALPVRPHHINSFALDADLIWVGQGDQNLYESQNSGGLWTNLNPPHNASGVSNNIGCPQGWPGDEDIRYSQMETVGVSGRAIVASFDGGTTWHNMEGIIAPTDEGATRNGLVLPPRVGANE
jgi:hypothetical protein